MRRLSAVVIIFVLFLCGCGGEKGIKPVVTGIGFNAAIEYYNEKYECYTEISEDKIMHITVNSPDTVKGLKLTVENGNVKAEYMGLTYEPKLDNMPLASFVGTVYSVLMQMDENRESLNSDDGNCVIKGECDGRDYEFTFSPSGLPICLSVGGSGLTVDFFDVTVLQKFIDNA